MAISHKPRTLKVVICHAPTPVDRVRAYRLYNLIKRNGISPWLAEEDLRPGEEVVTETSNAIRTSDVVIIGLSPEAIEQRGPFWRDLKRAQEVAEEQPEKSIFIIPVRFEKCELPDSMSRLHPLDLFQSDSYERLLKTLDACASKLHIQLNISQSQTNASALTQIDPYLGLEAFKEENAAFFFGRETFINKLEQIIAEKPMVAVIGPSGSGKSSVVFAGLIPRLKQENRWQVISFRPGAQPFRALAVELIKLLEEQLDEIDRLDETNIDRWEKGLLEGRVKLPRIIARFQEKTPQTNLLLVVDQFEELYTLCKNADEREVFLDFLLAVFSPLSSTQSSQTYPLFRLVLTLRADFFGYALSYRPFTDALQNAQQNLGPMQPEELRRVIELPARRLGVEIEQGLTERILEAVLKAPGNLPLLEFALTKLWEQRELRPNGEARLTHATYEAIGGVERAITSYANDEFKKLTEAEQQQAQRIFIQLVQPGAGTQDTRRVALKQEVGDESWALVQKLANTRLIVCGRDEANNQETVEIVHEALINNWERLQEWMNSDRTFRTWQERLRAALRQWESSQQDEGDLLRRASLAEAEEWLHKRATELSQPEKAFIQASLELRDREHKAREEQQRREQEAALRQAQLERQRAEAAEALVKSEQKGRRRQRSFLIGLSILLLIAIATSIVATIFAGVANQQKAEAQRQAEIAKAQALSGNAIEELEVDPELGILLATEGVNIAQKYNGPVLVQTTEALRRTLEKSQVRLRLGDQTSHHTDTITNLAYSSDGKIILSVSNDHTVRLWDTNNGKQLKEIQVNGACLCRGNLSPDGKIVVILTDTDNPRIWYVDSNLQSQTGDNNTVNYGDLTKMDGQGYNGKNTVHASFSPDSKFFVTAGGDGSPVVWDIENKRLSKILPVHTSVGLAKANFSFDGRYVITAGNDKTAKIWDLQAPDGQDPLVMTLGKVGESGSLYNAVFSPKDDYVVTVGTDSHPTLWKIDLQNKVANLERTFHGHTDQVSNVAFSPDGNYIVTVSNDSTARVWEVATGLEIATLKGHTQRLQAVAFSPDGLYVATAGEDTTIRIWNALPVRGNERLSYDAGLRQVAYSHDGKKIVASGGRWEALVWNLEKLNEAPIQLKDERSPHTNGLSGAVFSPDDRNILTSSYDGTAKIWDLQSNPPKVIKTLPGSAKNKGVRRAIYSPDAQLIATVTDGPYPEVRVWNITTYEFKNLYGFDGSNLSFSNVTFSPDNKYLVGAGSDGSLRIWDISSPLKEPAIIKDHRDWIDALIFNPDGKSFASGGGDSEIHIWDFNPAALWDKTNPPKPRLRLFGHYGTVSSVTYDKAGKRLVSTGSDKTVRIWDVNSGGIVATFQDHSAWVYSAAFSPISETVISGDDVGTILFHTLNVNDLLDQAKTRVSRQLTNDERKLFGLPLLTVNAEVTYAPIQPPLTTPAPPAVTAIALAIAASTTLIQAENGGLAVGSQTARQAYTTALQYALQINDTNFNNQICWYGSIDGFAELVQPACDRAVTLVPDYGGYIDSRGLNRALRGDTKGAISDFIYYVQWSKNNRQEGIITKRQGWIAELQAGHNPFDRTTLDSLRNESAQPTATPRPPSTAPVVTPGIALTPGPTATPSPTSTP